MAILNPPSNSGEAEVLLGAINAGGKGNDTDITTLNLNPGARIQMFVDELFPNGQDAASVEFRSNLPIALLPLQQDGLVLTTQDVFPPRSLETLFDD